MSCVYCGSVEEHRDHVVPLVVRRSGLPWDHALPDTVPACAECNQIASGHLFRSVEEKRTYIREHLEARHRRLLDLPEWTDEERAELGTELARSLGEREARRDQVRLRLAASPPDLLLGEPETLLMRHCDWCTGLFTPRHNQLYCGDACRKAVKRARVLEEIQARTPRPCEYCGEPQRRGRFCSQACGVFYRMGKVPHSERFCEGCGASHYNRRFCSRLCADRNLRAQCRDPRTGAFQKMVP